MKINTYLHLTFEWNINELHDVNALSGALQEISMQVVRTAIHKMKNEKSTITTGVAAEMLIASGESGLRWMTDLFNTVVK